MCVYYIHLLSTIGDCGVGGQCHRQHWRIKRSAMSNSSLIITPLMRNFRLTHPSPNQSSVLSREGNVSSNLSEVTSARETANFTFLLINPNAREVNITFLPAQHNKTTAREVNITFPTQPSGVSPDIQTAPDTQTSAPSTTSQTCPGLFLERPLVKIIVILYIYLLYFIYRLWNL